MPSLTPTADQSRAVDMAAALRDALALRNVPAHVLELGEQSAVSLWYGLVAWTDGRLIWWICPQRSKLGRDLYTYAWTPDAAAARLAEHYAAARDGLPALAGGPA